MHFFGTTKCCPIQWGDMPCANCGGTTKCIESSGGTENGEFRERYECEACGLKGTISGKAEEPSHTWEKTGCCKNQ